LVLERIGHAEHFSEDPVMRQPGHAEAVDGSRLNHPV
jgi:hypothetical protein